MKIIGGGGGGGANKMNHVQAKMYTQNDYLFHTSRSIIINTMRIHTLK